MIVGLMMAKNHSTRLKNKNILEFANGLSMFEFTLKENLKYKEFDEFFVISNCKAIKEICKKYPKVIFMQEPEVLAAQDESFKVIKFFLKFSGLLPEDILVFLPVTSPLRMMVDISNAMVLFNVYHCRSVVSVFECREPPQWSFRKGEHGFLAVNKLPMTSQNLKQYYHLNGAIYISSVEDLDKYGGFYSGRVIPYVMPYERSIDIDTDEDLELAKYYYNKRLK